MELKEITIEELSDASRNMTEVFVAIQFLYHPILKELKRKEAYIKKLAFQINREMFKSDDILLSLIRLLGIPESVTKDKEIICLIYKNKRVEIEFSDSPLSFSGSCYLSDSVMIFSDNSPYIKVIVDGERETVIVLPEGSGEYYMNLDKRESEKENRFSIIGNPLKLRECYRWYRDSFNG